MNQQEKQFWDLVDLFLNAANEHAEAVGPDAVNSALQYASARFSAFVTAANADDLADEKPEAIRFLTNHYRDVLGENFEDFIENPVEGKAKIDDLDV